MTLDEASSFFTAFFELEHEVRKANLEGAKTFAALHTKLTSMLADETIFAIPAKDVSKLTGDLKKANENAKKVIAARQSFWVSEHTAGKRRLFCAHASEPRKPAALTTPMMQFWAEGARVIATYFPCPACLGDGTVGGRSCPECKGRPWTHKSGEKIKATDPVTVKKLLRPTRPGAAARYDAL
ncbi:MAG: hypothetical protein U0228_33795 [Myxococcaceae bacterium]